jgi:hypothetical protein
MRNRRPFLGHRHPNVKLTIDDERSIEDLAGRGVTYRSIGSLYGISYASVGHVVRRERWRHSTGNPQYSGRAPKRRDRGWPWDPGMSREDDGRHL